MNRREALRGSAVATGRGDDGTTGLLFGGPRIAKDDPRTEAYGTIDEAVAALGLARAELTRVGTDGSAGDANGSDTNGSAASHPDASHSAASPQLASMGELLLRLQRELFVVGAELATTPDAWDRLEDGRTRVSEAMVVELEASLREFEAGVTMPREFVVPGETRLSAALEMARAVLRRAERRIVTLQGEGLVAGEWLLAYVNRLADLLWIVARAAEQGEQRSATPVRTGTTARAVTGAGNPDR